MLPASLAGWLHPVRDGRPAVGHVRFGDLAGTAPIDGAFGFGRGTPIDHFYIESFLDRNREDIAGRVLEIGDATYSRRFGGSASRGRTCCAFGRVVRTPPSSAI